jgi:hypothetical protein
MLGPFEVRTDDGVVADVLGEAPNAEPTDRLVRIRERRPHIQVSCEP